MSHCKDNHPALNRFRGQSRQPLIMVVRKAVFDRDVAILDIAGYGQATLDIEENPASHFLKRRGTEKADHRHRGRLRAPRVAMPLPCRRSA